MNAPTFSVIIPVYNRTGSILPTLESVKGQTFADFECFVIDDGSHEGDLLKMAVQSLEDTRFHYLRRKNGGASAARNTGIEASNGRYIALLDSDDYWLKGKLEADRIFLEDEFTVIFSPMIIERNGRNFGVRPRRGPYPDEDISEYLTCHQGFTPVSTLVIPQPLARHVRFDARVRFGDDTDFAVRLAAAGAVFKMHTKPTAIMNDSVRGDRLSQEADWKAVLAWLDRTRPLMTRRAYRAYRGWHVARLAAVSGEHRLAFSFYARALLKGALPPTLAARALGQILFPRNLYRRFQAILSRPPTNLT